MQSLILGFLPDVLLQNIYKYISYHEIIPNCFNFMAYFSLVLTDYSTIFQKLLTIC